MRYVESIKAHFILLPSYRRFPNDAEFADELKIRDVYNMPRRSYWFKKIENYGRKEQVQETWLHTIGNLTLTGYNSEYSDNPFIIKRDMENGFRDSPIRLNQSLRNVENWDEEAIKERANILADIAVDIWKSPKLPNDILTTYRPDSTVKSAYTINDYSYLSPTNSSFVEDVRLLFDALRKEILAIDSVVTEEYLKLYIAFKAETNFVDVVPQAKRLKLSLNMPFPEINDPKQMCKDTSNLGRWGNGDVEVGFSDIKDLPYIMSLIRQSFERQMNNSTF